MQEGPKNETMKKFNKIIANPPFSVNWDASVERLNDERFSKYGKLAPKSKADYAFVQHMVYNLSDKGIMAVVLPHGVLFRGGSEGVIRRYLIEKMNVLDAVIGLPANLFYGTSIPTCILIFRKDRNPDDSILFIDASKGFEKRKNQNFLREEDIQKILSSYYDRADSDAFSHNVTLQEIVDNDYNLNIPRYVDTFEEEEEIDIQQVLQEIKSLEAKRANLDFEINGYLRELGIIL